MTLQQKDRQYVWHPFTQQKNMQPPIPIVSAAATILTDENNNNYIDAISSWWVTLHGHAHPYIAQKIYEQALQLEQVIFAGFTHKPAADLAEKLIKILPGSFSKIFYSDNGSTSTEVAIKMALQYWWNERGKTTDDGQKTTDDGRQTTGKTKILAFNNAYHGDTFGAMSVSDRSVFTLAFHSLLFDVVFIDTPTKENINELKSVIENNADEIAAFIYEPLVQGAGGMKMYDASLLDELLMFVKEKNIICIADEVMTGFGRTGKIFASEYLHQKPDIICMSKGLTGGTMALGATACTEKIYAAFVNDDKLKTFFHGHSFTANPLACTAALASLDLLFKEECLQKINWIAEKNKTFSLELTEQKNLLHIKNIRTLGTILAFEIDEGNDEYLNNISQIFTAKSLAHGVYMRPLGNTVYIMPPYCITTDELDKIYTTMLNVCKAIFQTTAV